MNRNTQPYTDVLIDEVRERRRRLMEEHGFSLDKLYETIKKLQEEHPEKLVRSKAELMRKDKSAAER